MSDTHGYLQTVEKAWSGSAKEMGMMANNMASHSGINGEDEDERQVDTIAIIK